MADSGYFILISAWCIQNVFSGWVKLLLLPYCPHQCLSHVLDTHPSLRILIVSASEHSACSRHNTRNEWRSVGQLATNLTLAVYHMVLSA